MGLFLRDDLLPEQAGAPESQVEAGGFLLFGLFSKLALPVMGHAVDLDLLAHAAY